MCLANDSGLGMRPPCTAFPESNPKMISCTALHDQTTWSFCTPGAFNIEVSASSAGSTRGSGASTPLVELSRRVVASRELCDSLLRPLPQLCRERHPSIVCCTTSPFSSSLG